MSDPADTSPPDRDWFALVAAASAGDAPVKRVWVNASDIVDYPIGRTIIDNEDDWRVELVGPRIESPSNGIRQIRHPVFLRAVSAPVAMPADERFQDMA